MKALEQQQLLQAGTSTILPGGAPLSTAALPPWEARLLKSSSWVKPNHSFRKSDAMSGLCCCCKSLQLRKIKLLSAEMIIYWSCTGDSLRADRRTVAPTLQGEMHPSAETPETPCTRLKLETWALYKSLHGTPMPRTTLSVLELKLMWASKCPDDSSGYDSSE